MYIHTYITSKYISVYTMRVLGARPRLIFFGAFSFLLAALGKEILVGRCRRTHVIRKVYQVRQGTPSITCIHIYIIECLRTAAAAAAVFLFFFWPWQRQQAVRANGGESLFAGTLLLLQLLGLAVALPVRRIARHEGEGSNNKVFFYFLSFFSTFCFSTFFSTFFTHSAFTQQQQQQRRCTYYMIICIYSKHATHSSFVVRVRT